MNEKDSKNEDSSYEDPKMSQENVVEDATNIGNGFTQEEGEKIMDINTENLNGEDASRKISSDVRKEVSEDTKENS